MKHSLLAANLFIIAAVMTSCQKEQSELTLESLPDKAVITGIVKYEVGDYQAETDGAIISNYQLPISGQTVMVTIPTANYVDKTDGNKTDGNQYFEAVTDDDGNYRIEIPISTNPLTASIKVVPFYATKTLMRNNAIVEIPNALYNTTEAVGNTNSTSNIALNQRDIKVVNLVAKSASELPVAFDQAIEIEGQVNIQAWVRNEKQGITTANAYTGSSEGLTGYPVKIVAKIVDKSDYRNPKTIYEITKETTTLSSRDEEGSFSATMNLPSNCWDYTTEFTVSTEASLEEEFEHWYCSMSNGEYNWNSIDVPVIYQSASSSPVELSDDNKLIPVQIPAFTITTRPTIDTDEILGIGLTGAQDGKNIIKNDPFYWER